MMYPRKKQGRRNEEYILQHAYVPRAEDMLNSESSDPPPVTARSFSALQVPVAKKQCQQEKMD